MANILVLSKDPSLFNRVSSTHIGDARRRHIFYSTRLRERYPNSEIRIITYTQNKEGGSYDQPHEGLRLYGTRSYWRATYLFDLVRQLPTVLADGWRPDVVTVQTPWEEGVVGYLIARWLGANFLPQLHFDLFSPRWLGEHWLNPWRFLVAKAILRCADRVRVVSTPLRDSVIAQCRVPLGRIHVAPVGVNFIPVTGDKRNFKSRLAVTLVDRKMVLFVGHLYAPKNLELWVDVARLVIERVSAVAFVIVGDGPDECMLRERVIAAGLTDRFVFTGRQDHAVLPQIYAAADVFLLTSHYEGFGRVVLESLLSGVPVVSTACTGPEDLIEDGFSGYLLPCGDAAGLAERVIELLKDDSRAAAMGRAGRERAEQQFSLEALTDRMIDSWITA
jgi:glycosyltransferase involved in cell wall biosynthesis